jgi:hypothetical protein
MAPARRDALSLAALGAAALALRLPFLPAYDEDLDTLRFRLALERFDIAEIRPHAPFYPVYLAAAKLLTLLGASPRAALGLVCASSGAALIVLLTLLAFELLGRRAAALTALFALTSPFLWLSAEKLGSDTPGAALLVASLWLLARARRLPERAPALRTTAIVLLGLGLGVRLSYFPFALTCTLLVAHAEGGARALLARARDLAAGTSLWLVPLIVLAGARPLVMATLHQGLGHFGQWGGSAITVHSPSARLYGLVWGLWANLLAGSWIDAPPLRWLVAPIVLLLLALGAHRAFPLRASFRAQPELVLSMLAYFVWALLGQNTAGKPRHWLPLLLLLLLTIAAGADALLARHRAALAAPLLLAAAWLFDGAQLVDAHRDPSPVAAAARFLAEGSGRDQRPVIAGDAARLYAEGAPRRAVRWASGEAALVQLVTEAGEGGALLSSEALSPALRGELTRRGFTLTLAFSRPRSRYVDSLWYELALFEARPAALR